MANPGYRSECRKVIRIEFDNRLVTQTKGDVFARLYTSGDEYHNKELKGKHNPEEVIDRALRYNLPFSPDVLGLVITQYRGERVKIIDRRYIGQGRKQSTTQWARFVDLRNIDDKWRTTGHLDLDVYDIADPDSDERHIGLYLGKYNFFWFSQQNNTHK